MIKVKNLQKKYNKHTVFENVSIDFPEKGLFSIIGKNGSGKSTLLNIITGKDKSYSGEIQGVNLNDIGFIYQKLYLLENRTVYENILYYININNVSVEEETINEVLKLLKIYNVKDKIVSELSSGQKIRVSISRCVVLSPKIIIADEPTRNIDITLKKVVFDVLKELSKNRLVLIVSHDLNYVNRYSDYIYNLDLLNYQEVDLKYKLDYSNNIIENENIKINLTTDNVFKQTLRIYSLNDSLYVSGNNVKKIDNDIDLTETIIPDNVLKINESNKKTNIDKYNNIFKRSLKELKNKKTFLIFSFIIAAIFVIISNIILNKMFVFEKCVKIINQDLIYYNPISSNPNEVINDMIEKGMIDNYYYQTYIDKEEDLTFYESEMEIRKIKHSIVSEFQPVNNSINYELKSGNNNLKYGDILISSKLADQLIDNASLSTTALYDDLINKKIEYKDFSFLIKGVVKYNDSTIFNSEEYFINYTLNQILDRLDIDKNLTHTDLNINNNSVVVNKEIIIDDINNYTLLNKDYEVIEFRKDLSTYENYKEILNNISYEEFLNNYESYFSNGNILISLDESKELIRKFDNSIFFRKQIEFNKTYDFPMNNNSGYYVLHKTDNFDLELSGMEYLDDLITYKMAFDFMNNNFIKENIWYIIILIVSLILYVGVYFIFNRIDIKNNKILMKLGLKKKYIFINQSINMFVTSILPLYLFSFLTMISIDLSKEFFIKKVIELNRFEKLSIVIFMFICLINLIINYFVSTINRKKGI